VVEKLLYLLEVLVHPNGESIFADLTRPSGIILVLEGSISLRIHHNTCCAKTESFTLRP
jgi:hypothetical protein